MNTHYFNAENLCQLLIHSREQAHKTQRYMAKALRRSIQTIQNWEYGISAQYVLDFQAWFEVIGMNPLFISSLSFLQMFTVIQMKIPKSKPLFFTI